MVSYYISHHPCLIIDHSTQLFPLTLLVSVYLYPVCSVIVIESLLNVTCRDTNIVNVG